MVTEEMLSSPLLFLLPLAAFVILSSSYTKMQKPNEGHAWPVCRQHLLAGRSWRCRATGPHLQLPSVNRLPWLALSWQKWVFWKCTIAQHPETACLLPSHCTEWLSRLTHSSAFAALLQRGDSW